METSVDTVLPAKREVFLGRSVLLHQPAIKENIAVQ